MISQKMQNTVYWAINLTKSKIDVYSDVCYTTFRRTMCVWCAKTFCTCWTKPEVSSISGSEVIVRSVFFTIFVTLTLAGDLSEYFFGVELVNMILHQHIKFEQNRLSFEFRPLLRIQIFRFLRFFSDLDLGPISTKSWAVVNIQYMYLYRKMDMISQIVQMILGYRFDKIENWGIQWRHSDARSAKVLLTRNERTMCIACADVICTFWTKFWSRMSFYISRSNFNAIG